jgi:hypothetical protein
MIPLSARQKTVNFTDEDSVVWTFAVKTGDSEMRLVESYEATSGNTGDWMRKQIELFNEIVKGWSDSQKRMPEYPKDGKPALLFTSIERAEVFSYWHKANSLTTEEKKSS